MLEEKQIEKIKSRFGTSILNISNPYGLVTLEISPTKLIEILTFLKEDKDYEFNYLTDLCGTHYPEQIDRELGIVYHLHNLFTNTRIRIKTFVSLTHPHINTLVPLFPGANWMERETYDFYGIIFDGHPDLRRILNVDDMVAFPLRKEHPLEDPNRKDKEDQFFGR